MVTKAQLSRLFAFITAVYPQIKIPDGMVEAWLELLKDLDYSLAQAAVKKVLMQREYPTLPAVGEIRRAAAEIANGAVLTADEAWGLVAGAVEKYGYYREQEALAVLPSEVAAIVKNFGWREICSSEEPDVIRGQFRRAWEERAARRKEEAALPPPRWFAELAAGTAKALPEGGR